MAEYVRRKRPPADHPYWTHLHDRAHPPSRVWPVVVPTGIGLVVGLVAGFNDPLSVRGALKLAGTTAALMAGGIAVCCSIPLFYHVLRRPRTGEHWFTAVVMFALIGVFGALVLFVPLALLLIWYSACGGHGPWLGILIGAGIGVGPGALLAWFNRRQWAERRRRWPRWETMRRQHRRRTAAAAPEPAPAPVTDPLPPRADDTPSKAAG